jgi:hypothetical protein
LPEGYVLAPDEGPVAPEPLSDAPTITMPEGYELAKEEPAPVDPVGMAKAFGVGGAQGIIGIPGMAGDVTQLGKAGASYIPDVPQNSAMDWLKAETAKTAARGGNSAARGDIPGSFPLPTSKDIQGWIEHITGKFYEPKNDKEREAATAGSYLTSGVLNPGGIPRKIAQSVVGAGADIAAGRYTDENPYVKALAGIIGGAGTGFATAPGAADKLLRSKLPRSITEAHITQAGQLIERAAQGANPVRLTWPEALSQVTGQPVALDLQRILESHPQTRDTMQEFMAPRAGQVTAAARGEAANIGPMPAQPKDLGRQAGEVAENTIQRETERINAEARPHYQAAEPVQVGRNVNDALQTGPLGEIYGQTLREVRDPLNPAVGASVAHLPDDSVGVIDLVQRRMREQAENLRVPGEASSSNLAASNVERARDLPIQVAEQATGSRPNAMGDYERARLIEAQLRERHLAPLETGPIGEIAKSNRDTKTVINLLFSKTPESGVQGQIGDAVRTLAAQRPAVAEAIVRQHIEMTLDRAVTALQGGGNQFGGARLAKDLVGNPQERLNLQAAIEALPNGQARWQGMERMLEVMQATGQRQAKGSLTAFNAMDLQSMTSQGLANVAAIGASPSRWTKLAIDAYQGWSAGKNLDRFAQIITDPNSGDVLRRLATLPPDSPRAIDLIGRLVARTVGATTQPRAMND